MAIRIEANGGHGLNFGKHFSEQAKKNISKSQREIADKTRERMLGKKLSKETIEKRTASRISKYGKYTQNWGGGTPLRGSENSMSKRVMCIETGIEYPSAIEASEETGIDYVHLCENARGKRRSADGTHWKYLDPPKLKRPQNEESRMKRRGGNNGHAKPIICLETGIIYPASSILADELGVNRPRITKIMQKGGQFNGLHYQYIDKGEVIDGNSTSESKENSGKN